VLGNCLQCFDTVGWAAGRASGQYTTERWGAGVVICLQRGADLHTAQRIPLPLTVSCFSKIQIGFTQWCIAKNGDGYTQRGMAKGLKVPCSFMITEVSIRCQKNPEVGIRHIPAYTPQYTTGFTYLVPAHLGSPAQRAVKRVCVCVCVLSA